jgi:hypothetical protein
VALLAYTPGPAAAAAPVAAAPVAAAVTTAPALRPAEVQAAKARLLAAIEPCSTRVPRNDVVALGRCAQDLAIPNPEAQHGLIDLILTFFYCLWLQWPYGPDSLYPSVGDCMEVHGY